jgi:hypothetical protein
MPLADKSVHCVMTSPPYYGLRLYDGAAEGRQDIDWPAGSYAPCVGAPPGLAVPAQRAALGNESTVAAYIWHLLLVLRECRRVLRDDGVLWLNIADSYANENKWRGASGVKTAHSRKGGYLRTRRRSEVAQGNLFGVPQRLMLAAQADGWIVRNEVVWHKACPMPASVTGWRFAPTRCKCGHWSRGKEAAKAQPFPRKPQCDHQGKDFARPVYDPNCQACGGQGRLETALTRGSWRHTRAHESIFMLTKQMGYWADGEAVKEPRAESSLRDTRTNANSHRRERGFTGTPTNGGTNLGGGAGVRNPRSVLTPKPLPYRGGEHYATFPPELIRGLVLSSAPRYCCPQCGQGWAPVIEQPDFTAQPKRQTYKGSGVPDERGFKTSAGQAWQDWRDLNPDVVKGYRATCNCGQSESAPGVVLDPFCGTGTTGLVARELGLDFIGTDISFVYLAEHAAWRAKRETRLPPGEKLAVLMPLFAGDNIA